MPITLRKKAPFTCRAAGHHAFPLTDSDGTLCPEHEMERVGLASKAHAPIPRDIVMPSGRFMTESDWLARMARGPIWPVAVAEDFACRHDVPMGANCDRCGPIESARRGA